MDVFINEQLAMRIVCAPEYLDELVVGRLLTEGLIRSPDDIEAIHICELGLRARVMLRREAMEQLSLTDENTIETCCTDNRIMMRNRRREITPVRPLAWRKEWVLQMTNRMRQEEPLYEETHAVQAAISQSRIISCAAGRILGVTTLWTRPLGGPAFRKSIWANACFLQREGCLPIWCPKQSAAAFLCWRQKPILPILA